MAKARLSHGILLAAFCCLMAAPASAIYHIVGGSLGWTIPPNQTFFEDWAKPRVIGVDDKLLFPFRSLHNVVEVAKEDFANCTQQNIINIYPKGPVIVNFTAPGDHFYYSSVGTQCEAGLKLHITVVASQGSSGRNFTSDTPTPAPSSTSSSAGAIGGWGMVVTGVTSFVVAWLSL